MHHSKKGIGLLWKGLAPETNIHVRRCVWLCVCVCVCVCCVHGVTKYHNNCMHVMTYKTNQIIIACMYMYIPKNMTQLSNFNGFSLQTYFFHSIVHYKECIDACNSVSPDPTVTVDNVTQILSKIPRHKWEEVMGGGGLDIPRPLL